MRLRGIMGHLVYIFPSNVIYFFIFNFEEEILCNDPTWIVELSRQINDWFKTTFSLRVTIFGIPFRFLILFC